MCVGTGFAKTAQIQVRYAIVIGKAASVKAATFGTGDNEKAATYGMRAFRPRAILDVPNVPNAQSLGNLYERLSRHVYRIDRCRTVGLGDCDWLYDNAAERASRRSSGP